MCMAYVYVYGLVGPDGVWPRAGVFDVISALLFGFSFLFKIEGSGVRALHMYSLV